MTSNIDNFFRFQFLWANRRIWNHWNVRFPWSFWLAITLTIDKVIAQNVNFAHFSKIQHYLLSEMDATWGGFSGAPKFPMPNALSFILDQGATQNNSSTKSAAQAILFCAESISSVSVGIVFIFLFLEKKCIIV